MLYPIINREDLQKLNELISLENQVQEVRLQDKLGKQKFHEDMKKVFGPVIKSLENTSQDITKTITETSIKNNRALDNLNIKHLEIMIDRGRLASYMMSSLSKINIAENTSQFKLVKDSSSYGVVDLLIHHSIPITLDNNLLIFLDTGKEFELKGDSLKMITNKNCNVDIASISDKKLL